MTGEERRQSIIKNIREAKAPISGTALAKMHQVSRQIIVQDIAILRASDYEIYSTPKGYVLSPTISPTKQAQQPTVVSQMTQGNLYKRVYKVAHTDEQIEDELNTFVDLGGKVVDVFIEHEVYGSIRADLPMHCRRHVQEFIAGIRAGKSSPLKNLSSGEVHFHTVVADSEETLDMIEQALREKGYLM